MSTYSARELMETEFPEPRFAVPALIPEGLTFFAGAPKLGKSWLALGLSIAIASGGHALGKIKVDQGEVQYLALEDSPRRLKGRLSSLLNGSGPPEGLSFETRWLPLADGGAEDIAAYVSTHPACRLVVVDVFARLRSPAKDSGDRYMHDYLAAEQLQKVASEHGVAIVAVHHTRKAAADDYIETVSGTFGLAAAADTVAVLKRSRGQADAEFRVTGRDIEEQSLALKFAPAVGTWSPLRIILLVGHSSRKGSVQLPREGSSPLSRSHSQPACPEDARPSGSGRGR
jgi:RecA-family ATPase